MDIEHKKTALKDDAILYQKREDHFERKDLSGLSAGQKLGYFKDYYLKTVLIVVAILIFLGSFLYNIIFHPQQSILRVAVVGEGYLSDTEGLAQELRDAFELTSEDQTIVISNYNLDDYQQQMALTAIMAAGDLDALICDEDYFLTASASGLLADLHTVLPAQLYSSFDQKGMLLEASEEELDTDGNVVQTYDPLPRGIQLTDSGLYQTYGGYSEHPIIGIYTSCQRLENAITFVRLMSGDIH
ncbi:MAG: hypothetical protein Q4B57_09540 [Eubacteriales bacterium]|nr:hypothetical protein [Eubacteriales bacterium]